MSDQIGRRTAMLLGLSASLVGTLLFAVSPDVWWVFAGRVFMGVGVGLFPRADSWYLGSNIPGKPREMLSLVGSFSTYTAKCNESAERGYEGFAIS
jgi:MFS family permease